MLRSVNQITVNRIRVVFLVRFVLALTVASSAFAEDPKPDPPEEQIQDKSESTDDYYELLEVFVDSLDQIERNYVKQISRRELIEAAIDGMVDRLDAHSSYIPPKDVDQFRSSVESKFGGIGLHVAAQDGHIMVISPVVGAPAYSEGVLAGDRIVEIDGESTEGLSLDGAVRKLKGDVGTKVAITVQQGDKGKRRAITITRAMVRVDTILGTRRNPDDSWNFMHDEQQGIGYVRLDSFSRDTARDLRRVLMDLESKKLRGLVLDLRFNPGGLLTSAIEICDLFVSEGLIVSTKGRNTEERSWQAKTEGTFGDFPIAVLINGYSASASEIVSACLQDHDRAVVVGERSFGKGSVQNVIDLDDGNSVLKLTTASYCRPNGHNIHRFDDAKDSDEWGVTPDADYEIKLSDDELKKLLVYRRDQYVVRGHPGTASPSEDGPGDATDTDDAKDGESGGDTDDAKDDTKDGSKDVDDSVDDGQPPEQTPFEDRQLQKAFEYLSSELARAE